MSFGFSVGDFVTVGQLAFKLYHDCYKIARGAPHEVQLLTDEMKTLSSSLAILQAEAQDPDSILVQAGHDRVKLVSDVVHGIGDTLKELEKAASKYGILVSSSKRKHLWTKLKWSMESSSIDKLRGKLNYHNTCMNLLLTSVGNSSLQRLESSTRALEQGIKEVKSAMYANKAQLQEIAPSISAINDDIDQALFSAAFLKHAEMFQSWRSINLDQWIEAGRWWLIRAQIAVYSISGQKESSSIAAYTDLMKASWILVDIIACHPQTPFAAPTTIAEVRILLAQIKRLFAELSAMNLSLPDWGEFDGQDFRIWESSSKTSSLRPQRSARTPGEWMVEGGEQVLFQQFALYKSKIANEIQPCMLLLLVQKDATGARIVALNQGGVIVKELSCNENLLRPDHISNPFVFTDDITYVDIAETICFKANSDFSDSKKRLLVPFEDTELTFSTPDDARLFKYVLSGIIIYLHSRQAKHNDTEDLKAFILLTAIIDGCKNTVATLMQRSRADVSCLGKDDDLPGIAQTLASQYIKGIFYERQLWKGNKYSRDLPSILSWAIQYGHLALVASLLGEYFPMDDVKSGHFEADLECISPLRLAAYSGHISVIQLLLSRGFNIREKCWRPPALNLAIGQGHKEVVLLLLENGADIDADDLHEAVANGQIEVLRILLDRCADFEVRDMLRNQWKFSALHEAAEKGHTEALQMLLDRHADVDFRDMLGATALHAATTQKDMNIVQILLDRGADVDSKTFSGQTALMLAALSRSEATMWLLMSRGANVLEADNCGRKTTHCAMATSNSMISTVLNKACALLRGTNFPCSPIREPRRARIVFEIETKRRSDHYFMHDAKLWLDSHHAYIEASTDWPRGVNEQHRKTIEISRPIGLPDLPTTSATEVLNSEYVVFSIEFTVIHQEEVLNFTVENKRSVRLEVLNGGVRDSKQIWESLYDWERGKYVSWKGVELDPDAEIVKDLSQSDASHYAICGDSNATSSLESFSN